MLDLAITGGTVLDGSGGPPRRADIGIKADRIESVGDLEGAESAAAIDARERIVCPGFIDAHSHSDTYLLIEPSSPSKLHQGVTTEVVGNCGASAAPRLGEFRMPSDWREKSLPGPWSTVGEYRALLEQARPAPNVVLLVGHNALRAGVVGYAARAATDHERRQMKHFLRQSLAEGARGLSTGLLYVPGMFASPSEIVELAAVVAEADGIYTSHMRSESDGVLAAIEETLRVGRTARVRLEISHLKTSGRANWGALDRVLELVRTAREEGVDVAADRYPYTAACTELDIVLPAWAHDGGREATLRRLRDPADRARLARDTGRGKPADYWSTVTIGSTRHPDNAGFQGRPLTDVAQQLGLAPVEAALRLIETDEMRTTAFFFGMSEENMRRILAEPYVMLGSDASLRALTGPLSADYPHPRAFGTFPRFVRMALDGKTVALPEAVRKMTSLPATHFRLKDRGLLARRMYADVVVFDPLRVRDAADYAAPRQLPEGICDVIVNGVRTLADGKLTGERAGRVL
jgi:N-acyl-D-amino-acid deacylase